MNALERAEGQAACRRRRSGAAAGLEREISARQWLGSLNIAAARIPAGP